VDWVLPEGRDQLGLSERIRVWGGGVEGEYDWFAESVSSSMLWRWLMEDSTWALLNGRGSMEYPESWKRTEGWLCRSRIREADVPNAENSDGQEVPRRWM
jgi:hypothetical protein